MLSGWASAFFGAGGAEQVLAERTHEHACDAILREFVAQRLRERAPTFFEDDVMHGRRVIDAVFALADALAVRRRRFFNDGARHRELAEALVSFIVDAEGSSEAHSQHVFAIMTDQWCERNNNALRNDGITGLMTRPVIELDAPRFSALTHTVARTWVATLNKHAGTIAGVIMTGTSHHDLPKKAYHDWMLNLATMPEHAAYHTYNIHYTGGCAPPTPRDASNGDGEDGAASHELVARQALAPLFDSLSVLRQQYDDAQLRLDFTLNIELTAVPLPRKIDNEDEHENDELDEDVAINCSVAYRVYALPTQDDITLEGRSTLPSSGGAPAPPRPPAALFVEQEVERSGVVGTELHSDVSEAERPL